MGGFGSGSYYRWDKKITVEDGLTLDLNKLLSDSSIKPGVGWQATLTWSNSRTGEKVASIGYEANLIKPENSYIRLHYNHKGKPQDYKVHLTTTQPHYGGLRWWFVCPISGERVGKLYSPPGQPFFASRKVFNLSYQSQRENHLQRMLDKSYKLRKRLDPKAETYFEAIIPNKPKGMHWKTYNAIVDEIYHLEKIGWAYMEQFVADIPRGGIF